MIVRLRSPAKINLFLKVLSKRKDGYHEIETLFERISLSDYLIFTPARGAIRVESNSDAIPRGSRNLVYQAAKLLRERCKIKSGVRIRIEKNIPVSAGLGGGSSNAATALLGLNRLWRLRLPRRELLKAASSLGSDVAFFVLDTPFALGRGRGEIVRKIRGPHRWKIWHCLVKPPLAISTQKAYRGLKPSFLTPPMTDVKMLFHSIQKGDSKTLSKLLTNSLELSLNKRVNIISEIKKKLAQEGALGCLMSGSGSSVFGVYRSRKDALKAARNLRKNKRWRVFVVSTL